MTGAVKSVGRKLGLVPDQQAQPLVIPAAPPPPPSADTAAANAAADASRDAEVAAQEQLDAARRRRGRAATVLTGASGAGLPENTATKTLLGG